MQPNEKSGAGRRHQSPKGGQPNQSPKGGQPFMKEETRFSGRYANTVFETLKFAYRQYIGRIVILLLCGFAGRTLLLSNANIIGQWVDRFCKAPAQCRPVSPWFESFSDADFVRLLAGVTIAGFFFTVVFRLLFSRLSARAVSQLYDEVTLRTSRLPMRFFDTTPVGAVVTRFSSDYGNVFRLFGGPLAEFCVIIFDLSGMILLVTIASPWYLPLFLLIGALNWVVYRLNRDRLRQERRELSASRAPSIAHFSETTQGAGTIRVFSRQKTFSDRFRALNDKYLSQRLRTFGAVFRFSYQMSVMSALLLLLTGLTGYYLVQAGRVSVGSVGVAFTFIALSSGSMQMFFEWMSQLEEALTGIERLDNYLRSDLEHGLRLPPTATFPTEHPRSSYDDLRRFEAGNFGKGSSAEVAVSDLWFRYSSAHPFVLRGVSFEVRPGERLGIVGRTGSGKSSLIQALFYLYTIEKGRIAIDGHVPLLQTTRLPREGEVDLSRYRRAVALIGQEPTLFRATLRENLSLGVDYSDVQLLGALEKVGLKPWFENQVLGFDSGIEERGRNLSLGERQLLCMARCLLQASPVIVMDEATSAIDPQTEEILVRATDEFFRGRTQLIIAHRLSTLESCDRILWLKDGVVHRLGDAYAILAELRAAGGQDHSY